MSDLSTHFFPNSLQSFDVHMKREWGGPQVHQVLTDSIVFKQQIYCSILWMGLVVCGLHNCMIPNIKTYFDKKVMFLALVPVLQ